MFIAPFHLLSRSSSFNLAYPKMLEKRFLSPARKFYE